MFSDKELYPEVEGGIEVLDFQNVKGKNDPILDGKQTLEFVSLIFNNCLIAKFS